MRILFIGGTKRGYSAIRTLIEQEAKVVGVISLRQDEHEEERYELPIKELAQRFEIPCYETKWMNEQNYVELISNKLQPDIAFVVGCRILIPKEIYQIPLQGTLAIHDSLLPQYRGFAPLNWAILNGENYTGVTLFYLNELMDGGDIVAQKRININSNDTAPMVYEQICQATVDIILETYLSFYHQQVTRIKQNYAQGSFTCSRTPQDGLINWSQSTITVYNQIRALTYPYPGAFTFYKGKKLNIWRAKLLDNHQDYVGRIPGRVVCVSKSNGYVDVLTGDGIIRIFEVQFEAEEKTSAANIIKSVRTTLGLQVVDLLERIKSLEQQVVFLTEEIKNQKYAK